MAGIVFTANGAEATAEVSGKLTSGMVGVPVLFFFDSEWDGLNAVAVFEGGGKTISVPLLVENETVLPWEVIVKANTRLRIGAEGRKSDGSIVIPTVWANVGYIDEGVKATEDEGNPSTPGIYDQIMAAIEAGQLQGEPGFSPTVSVTDIEGGHRVTITDETGTKSFDVMDGDGSGASVYVQADEPADAPVGALWFDTDEDTPESGYVKTVNGVAPDESGNVEVEVDAQPADFVITMTTGEDKYLIPDKTWVEITEAYQNGRRLTAVYNGREYALSSFYEDEEAHFVHNEMLDLKEYTIYITSGNIAWMGAVAANIYHPVRRVEIQEDSDGGYSTNMTFAAILELINDGNLVYAIDQWNNFIPLSWATEEEIVFYGVWSDGSGVNAYGWRITSVENAEMLEAFSPPPITGNENQLVGFDGDGNMVAVDKPTYTAEEVGALPDTTVIPEAVTDDHINSLIDAKLEVIENGTY